MTEHPKGDQADTSRHDALLAAALGHVPFVGMNDQALLAGAEDIGMTPDLARVLIPGGGAGLAAANHRRADAELARWMADDPPQGAIRDRVAQAVMKRLSLVDREVTRAAAAVLALPVHLVLATRLMAETADIIWRGLGDRSDDVNWWTKRAILASVIGATVLYWLGDDSPDLADTRGFLDRRIQGIMGIEKGKARLRKIPGMTGFARAMTGWITAPTPRDLPGGHHKPQ